MHVDSLKAGIERAVATREVGRIRAVGTGTVTVAVRGRNWRLGDRLRLYRRGGAPVMAEVVSLGPGVVQALPDGGTEGLALGDAAEHLGALVLAPDRGWIGRIVDPFGRPLDGRPLAPGGRARPVLSAPPPPAQRRRLGPRLATGLAVFDTILPVARGQRLGLFAGSGIGKSSLLAQLARGIEADVVVLGLVGERGREVLDFVEEGLGPDGMGRAVVVAATSDQGAAVRRRCAHAAMTVAEHFRDEGLAVLLLIDSVTRFAEAHREIALAAGEPAALRGFPPSVASQIMALAERAGPGTGPGGDITAILTVLVAGSDMDEPVADILRGVLDGHVILDRAIAERGRFPAVDVLRSVSRSLPAAASAAENRLIGETRRLLGAHERAALMIRAGLYAAGSDPVTDAAVRVWDGLDQFFAAQSSDPASAFAALEAALIPAQGAAAGT